MARSFAEQRWVAPAFGLGSIVAAFAIVEALLRADMLNRYILPLPSDVVMAFARVVTEEKILSRMGDTAFEVFASGLLVVIVGVPLGALFHRYRVIRDALETWVAALAAAPVVLAFPLFLVLFGRGQKTIIIISFVYGVAPVLLKTLEGLASTRPVLINVGRSLNMTSSQMFWKILMPSALPSIFTGVRLSWTFCLVTVVAVEFLVNLGGLGQLINDLAERYDLPGTYAGITFVILLSVLFFIALERVETWLRPHR